MVSSSKQVKSKERKRIRRTLLSKNQLKRRAEFPEIVVKEADALVNPVFVAAVLQVINGIDFYDPAMFPSFLRRFFENIYRVGISNAIRKSVQPFVTPELRTRVAMELSAYIGEFIMTELKNILQIERYVPYNDFHVEYSGRNIIISFDSLLSCYSKYGKIYYSRRKPKVNIEGNEYIVAFSRHAIERIRQRTVGNAYSFGGTGDAFAYLSFCNRYDHHSREWNGKNKHYLSFYSDCKNGFVSAGFVQEILEKKHVCNYSYAYRIGYLPIGLWNGFACSATLLVPGMKGTPEQILLKNADIDEDLRTSLIQANQFKLSFNECVKNGTVGVLKWYHDNGVPQVIKTGRTLFPRYI